MDMQLYDIYDAYFVPFWQTREFFYAMLLLSMVLVSGMSWFLYRWWKKKKQKPATPWERSLSQLVTVQKKLIANEVVCREVYFSLTAISKQYLYERYQYEVLDKTDDEMINFFRTSNFSEKNKSDFEDFFKRAEASKFAHMIELPQTMFNDIDLIESFIRKTIPAEIDVKK